MPGWHDLCGKHQTWCLALNPATLEAPATVLFLIHSFTHSTNTDEVCMGLQGCPHGKSQATSFALGVYIPRKELKTK